MKDSWKQTRPLPILKESVSFPIDIKHLQIIAFAKSMDDVLTKNDYKGGWKDCDIQYLRARLVEEMGEYFAWVGGEIANGIPQDGLNHEQIRRELVDIANFAMMLWDRS